MKYAHNYKRILCIVIAVAVIVTSVGLAGAEAYGASRAPSVAAYSAMVMDSKTGDILYEKNAYYPRQPASTAKIMTAILVCENIKNLDKEVTVTEDGVCPIGNNIGLKEGEVLTVRQLLNTLLVYSANDTAYALAVAVAGDVDTFVDMMNAKAKELGCQNTHFINPNGLNDGYCYVCAYDLCVMAKYAMEKSTIRNIVCKTEYTVPKTNKSQVRKLKSTNLLLAPDEDVQITLNGRKTSTFYDKAIGMKTGYTSTAHGCLVAVAEDGNTEVITVILRATGENRFSDAINLCEWAFDNYNTVTVKEAGTELGYAPVELGSRKKVPAILSDDAYVTLSSNEDKNCITAKTIYDNCKAPIAEGDKVGELVVTKAGVEYCRIPLIAGKDVPQNAFVVFKTGKMSPRGWILLCVLALVIAAFVAARKLGVRIRPRKRVPRSSRTQGYTLSRRTRRRRRRNKKRTRV